MSSVGSEQDNASTHEDAATAPVWPRTGFNKNSKIMTKTRAFEAAKKDSKEACQSLLKAFADCATDRTFSVAWACREEKNAFSQCFAEHMEALGQSEAPRHY